MVNRLSRHRQEFLRIKYQVGVPLLQLGIDKAQCMACTGRHVWQLFANACKPKMLQVTSG